jgi:uncharacterized protein (DUF2141 family)
MSAKLCVFFACLNLFALDPSDARLTVHVTGAKNRKGLIRVALWNQPAGFPINPKRVLTGASAEIMPDGDAYFTFPHLNPGDYAVSTYHDENLNGKLDTNLVGIPKEEFGFSNNARSKIGPPSFGAARFFFDGKSQTVEIAIESFRFAN